jgi:hypothetical protein
MLPTTGQLIFLKQVVNMVDGKSIEYVPWYPLNISCSVMNSIHGFEGWMVDERAVLGIVMRSKSYHTSYYIYDLIR